MLTKLQTLCLAYYSRKEICVGITVSQQSSRCLSSPPVYLPSTGPSRLLCLSPLFDCSYSCHLVHFFLQIYVFPRGLEKLPVGFLAGLPYPGAVCFVTELVQRYSNLCHTFRAFLQLRDCVCNHWYSECVILCVILQIKVSIVFISLLMFYNWYCLFYLMRVLIWRLSCSLLTPPSVHPSCFECCRWSSVGGGGKWGVIVGVATTSD
jgi:hypothetical protein